MIATWDKIKSWFKESTTILWARLQILLAAIWGVLATVDLSPVLNPKWMAAWLIVSGTITELTRRRTL